MPLGKGGSQIDIADFDAFSQRVLFNHAMDVFFPYIDIFL